jgi:hypothetical protein
VAWLDVGRSQGEFRRGPLAERVAERPAHHFVHQRLLAEPHLGFRGMHVDVHPVRRNLEKQMHLGAALLVGRHAVGIDNRVGDGPVLDDAAIDEHVLRTAHRPLLGERGDEPAQPQPAELALDGDQILAIAVDLVQPIRHARHRRHGEDLLAGAGQREPHLGVTECQLGDQPRHLRGFRAVGLQELAPGRQVVEHVGHFDHRAFGPTTLHH